jgi:hypothetical protein
VATKTKKQMAKQTSRAIKEYLTIDGETKSIREWAKSVGMDQSTLRYRVVQRGWTPKRALTTPVPKRASRTKAKQRPAEPAPAFQESKQTLPARELAQYVASTLTPASEFSPLQVFLVLPR